MLDMGWSFDTSFLGSTGDTLHQKQFVHEIYQLVDKKVSSKVTVPILWDKKTNTIVNNESAEIIRILNYSFNDISNNHDDYYPANLQSEIDNIMKLFIKISIMEFIKQVFLKRSHLMKMLQKNYSTH